VGWPRRGERFTGRVAPVYPFDAAFQAHGRAPLLKVLRKNFQGRGWQGHISVKKVSLAKDTTLMGVLWPFGSFITIVNSLNRDKWLSAVDCL